MIQIIQKNHAVKYVSKRPPTYTAITEDSDGNTISVIKGLKDTCELLTDPILDRLKQKLRECLRQYKGDEDFDFSSTNLLSENYAKN